MKNKKAELTTTEIVKIILAVIGISILIYLAVNLYGIFLKKTDIEQAEASLNDLYFKIKKVESGEDNNVEVLIHNPTGWRITSWPGDNRDKPEQCVQNYCVCICDGKDVLDCNNNGVCKNVGKEVDVFGDIPSGKFIEIDKSIKLDIILKNDVIWIVKETSKDKLNEGSVSDDVPF